MPSDSSSRHRHKDRRHKSRSRSPSRRHDKKERSQHSSHRRHEEERVTPDRSHTRVKEERLSPVRQIKRERWSPAPRDKQRQEQEGRHNRNQDRDHGDDRNQRDRRDNRRGRGQGPRRRNDEVDDSKFTYGKPGMEKKEEEIPEEDKAKPDYGLSGKLADDTNTFRGIVVKYNEPPEARKPKLKWRLYPFKGDEALPVLHIHRQSGYLLGRDRKVADIPVDHPSCSKQHAVLQFRSVEYTKDDGMKGRRTRPYIIDLGSANGTFVNNKKIESQRYVELLEKDTIKFGFSSRDYVILHDNVEVSPTAAEGVD